MATPINPAGYQFIRDAVQAAWTHIELRNSANAAVLCLPLTDPRVTWTHQAGAQELELTVVITSDDADIQSIGLPINFAASALYAQASGGSVMDGPRIFDEFIMAGADPAKPDELTVRHRIQIPQV